MVGPVLYLLSWLILGALRPGYSVLSQTISDLGVGPNAALLNLASMVHGALLIIGVAGVFAGLADQLSLGRRVVAAGLLSLSGVSSILEGLFPLDRPVLHWVAALVGLVLVPAVGFPVAGTILRRVPRFRRYGRLMVIGGPVLLVLFVGFLLTGSPELGVAGLTARALVIMIHAWYVVLALIALCGVGPGDGAGSLEIRHARA